MGVFLDFSGISAATLDVKSRTNWVRRPFTMPEIYAAFEVPYQALIQWSDDDRHIMSLSLMHITPLWVLRLLISTLPGLEPSMISKGGSTATPLLSLSSGSGM
jgi:hypothetical protein